MSEPGGWTVKSSHRNLVAFKLQAEHLKSALRAANSSNAEYVELRLTSRSRAGAESAPADAKPYLCLTSKGLNSNMTHDIPISRLFVGEGEDTSALTTSGKTYMIAF